MHKKNGISCVGREAVKAFIDLFSDGHGIGLLKKFRAPAAIVVERGVTGAGKAELGGAEALDDNGLTSGIFRGAPAPDEVRLREDLIEKMNAEGIEFVLKNQLQPLVLDLALA